MVNYWSIYFTKLNLNPSPASVERLRWIYFQLNHPANKLHNIALYIKEPIHQRQSVRCLLASIEKKLHFHSDSFYPLQTNFNESKVQLVVYSIIWKVRFEANDDIFQTKIANIILSSLLLTYCSSLFLKKKYID